MALAEASDGAYQISIRAPGLTQADVPLAGHALAYPDGPNADVTIDPVADGFEFGAVLANPTAPNTISFAFSTQGLNASLASDGQTIVFTDPNSCATPPPSPSPSPTPSAAPSGSPAPTCTPSVVAEVMAPGLAEANGAGSDPHSVAVALDASAPGLEPGEVLATYTIDPGYLAATGRTYPVTLDPTTVYTYCQQTGLSSGCTQHSGSAGSDVIIASANSSPSTFTRLRVGKSTESGYAWGTNRELLYFPQVALGDGAQVVGARIELYQTANYGSGQSIIAYANQSGWGSSTVWSTQPTNVSGLSSLSAGVHTSTGWVDINATSMVNEMYVLSTVAETATSIPNYGFKLELTTETQPEVQFDNNANGPAGFQPELVISYSIPAAAISFDPSLGPDWSPTKIPGAGQTFTLPVIVTNNSGFTMPHYTAGATDYYQIALIQYFAGFDFDETITQVNLPADIASGGSSSTIPVTSQVNFIDGQDTVRLDLVHYYTDSDGVPTVNYDADWAWQSRYYARDKNNLDPGNVHWTGTSVIERDEWSAPPAGSGPDQGDSKSVAVPDGGTASIDLDTGQFRYQGPPGVGFNDLGTTTGISYYYNEAGSCGGVLHMCGWATNLDEQLVYTGPTSPFNSYVDAQGNAYTLTASPDGQISSAAPVQIDHNRTTLFDDSEIPFWSTTSGTAPTWTTAQAYSGIYSYSEPSTTYGFNDLSNSGLDNPDIDQFPLVSFAVKGVGTAGAAVGFEIKDVTTNVTNWLFYTVGTDFTIGSYSKIALGGTISAWNDTINRYIRSDVAAQGWTNVGSSDDLQVVGLELRGNGTTGGTDYFDAVHFDPRTSGMIADNTPTWTLGGSAATADTDTTHGEVYAGTQAIKVTPTTPTTGPTATSDPFYGQFPYVTWAWRKVGGNSIGYEFSAKDLRTGVTKSILYYAGGDEGYDATNVVAIQVSATVPTSWTTVSRDLLADARQALGFYNDFDSGGTTSQAGNAPSPDSVQGVSYSLIVPDGQYGLFDAASVLSTPHPAQPGDDYVVTEPGGATHSFNRDGMLTSMRDLDGNTTTIAWTYLPLGVGVDVTNANYELNYMAAPGDGQAVTGGTALRRIVATNTTGDVRLTEELGTTSSHSGRYMEFFGSRTGVTTVIPPSRSAPCATSGPTGCLNYAYGGAFDFLDDIFDPRSDGVTTSPGHDLTAIQYNSAHQATEIDDLSGTSAAPLLHVDAFESGAAFPDTVEWEDAAGLAAPGGNVQTRFEDLDPNGQVLNEYAPVACAGSNCSGAHPGDKLATYQTDGLARVTWSVEYRGVGQTLPLVSRRSTLASVALDSFADPINGSDTVWTQSPEQYAASVAICPTSCAALIDPAATPDAYRTFMGYNQFGQPASVTTPHRDSQAALYADAVAAAAPLAYWRLDDTSTVMADSSGHGYGGTYASAGITHSQAGALVGDSNAATTFASTSGYASVTTLPTTSGTFTISAWVDPSSAGNQLVLGSRGSSDHSFDLQFYNGLLHTDIGNGTAWLTTAADAPFTWVGSTWYDVVEVVTPTTWTLYVNGAAIGSGGYASGAPLLSNSTHTFTLGNIRTGTGGFNGSLDEVAVYTSALSAGQVATQYNAGRDAVTDTASTSFSTVDGGTSAVHFIPTDHPILSTDQFLTNPGFESGLDGWTTGGTWYTTSTNTGHGALQLSGAQTATQDATLVPGETFRFGFAGYKSTGTGLAYDVTYQKTTGTWAELPGLGPQTLTTTSWPGGGSTSAAWNLTVPFDGTGRIRAGFSLAGGSGTGFVDDVAIFTTDESHSYNPNGTLNTSTDANGIVTYDGYLATATVPAIFPKTVVGNYGGSGATNVVNTTTTNTYDVWGRVVDVQDPDGVDSVTTYVSSGNGFETEVGSTADDLGNTTTYTYDSVGNQLTATPPNGAAETTTKTYTFQNAVLSSTPPADATGHQAVTTNTYNAQGQLTQAAQDSSGIDVVTTYTYDAYGRQTGSVADSGGIAATTTQTYDLQGNPLVHKVYAGPGTSNPEATTTFYDAAGTANAVEDPTAPGSSSAAPNCTSGLHATGAPYCDSYSLIGFDGSTPSSVDAYGRTSTTNLDFSGHTVRTIANYVTGTYSSGHPDQDVTSTSTFDVLGRPTSSSDTLGLTQLSTYDALGRVTLARMCDSTCTTYTWHRTDYTPAGRTWKTSAQGDQTNYAAGDTAVAWTETLYDADGRAATTISNYDVTGTGDTWAAATNAGTFLEGFEASSTDWGTTTDSLLPAAPASFGLDATTARTGLASLNVLTSSSAINSGVKWALSADRYGSFVFQANHYYHLHAMVMSPTIGKTLQAFLGTTATNCQSSNVTTSGAWQSIDCTWHPTTTQSSGVEAVIRQGDASPASITVRIDDVQVFESDSTGAPLTATPTNVTSSLTAFDPDGRVLRSTLAPGHLAKDGSVSDTGIPVTATAYDNLGRHLTVTVDATAGATGSYPSVVRGTAGLVADARLNEPAGSTTTADLVSAATMTASGVTFGGTSPLTNAGRGPTGTAGSGSFNGTSSAISRSSAALGSTDNFTLAAWFKFASTPSGEQAIVFNGTDAGGGYGLALNSSGHLGARLASSTFLDSGLSPTMNTWHLAVLVRSGGTSTVYLDGVAGAPTSTTAPAGPAAAFSVGREDASIGRYFAGSIAEVAAFNQPLSAAMVGALYGAGNPAGVGTADQNLTTAYAFDGLGRTTDVMDPTGVDAHAVYDHLGRTTSGVANYAPGDPTQSGGGVDVTLNATSLAAYDELGEVVATCSPDAVVAGCTSANIGSSNLAWHYAYSPNGHQFATTPPVNATLTALDPTEAVYDAADLLVSTTYSCPSGATITFGTACTSYTRRVNDTIYDGLRRLSEAVVANSSNVTQLTNDTTYDGVGDVVARSFDGSPIGEGTSTAAFAFDTLERPSSTTINSVTQTSQTYAPGGQVATRTDFLVNSTASSFTYDALGRLVTAYSPLFGTSTNLVGFSWRLDGLLDGRTQYSGVASLAYSYDGAKRPLTQCSSSTCSGATIDVERIYDRAGNTASETQNLVGANTNQNGTQSFTYDALNRVTGSTLGSITKSYTYDASSNRLTAVDGGVTSTFTYDRADEIIKDNYASTDHAFTYDAYGNLTAESISNGGSAATTNYVYDLADRMTKITQADSSILGFTFDPLGRHATRTSGSTPTTIDTYGYVGSSDVVVQDYENVPAVAVNAAIDGSADRLMTSTGLSSCAWLIPDLHGDVVGQTGTSGTVTDAFRYDAFGVAEGTTLTGSIPTPWRYQGRLLESSSGGRDLYDFTARSYAPDLGAFTQLDSVAGSAQNPASLDRYLYADANPETLIDPSGHVGCGRPGSNCKREEPLDKKRQRTSTGNSSGTSSSTSTVAAVRAEISAATEQAMLQYLARLNAYQAWAAESSGQGCYEGHCLTNGQVANGAMDCTVQSGCAIFRSMVLQGAIILVSTAAGCFVGGPPGCFAGEAAGDGIDEATSAASAESDVAAEGASSAAALVAEGAPALPGNVAQDIAAAQYQAATNAISELGPTRIRDLVQDLAQKAAADPSLDEGLSEPQLAAGARYPGLMKAFRGTEIQKSVFTDLQDLFGRAVSNHTVGEDFQFETAEGGSFKIELTTVGDLARHTSRYFSLPEDQFATYSWP